MSRMGRQIRWSYMTLLTKRAAGPFSKPLCCLPLAARETPTFLRVCFPRAASASVTGGSFRSRRKEAESTRSICHARARLAPLVLVLGQKT